MTIVRSARAWVNRSGPLLAAVLRPFRGPWRSSDRPRQAVFTDIYRQNGWRGQESVSGTGSSLQQTDRVRRELPPLLKALGVRSMLDAPCGDFHWMSRVPLGVDRYTGLDIVPELVEALRRTHGRLGREFLAGDLAAAPLPEVDLIFCRDCLVHLPFQDIQVVLHNLKKSGSKFLLTTTFPATAANRDLRVAGKWRPLNLQLGPFYFPKPVRLINEGCTEMDGRFRDKSLGLWRLADLPA